jgi:hypothetical protein
VTLAYEFSPAGATFTPAVPLTFIYEAKTLPAGFEQSRLVVALWNAEAKEWETIEGAVVDSAKATITVMIDHFSIYTVLAYSKPATCKVQSVTVNHAQALTGDTISINVAVVNSGDRSGSYTVTLKVDGKTTETRDVTVDANSQVSVTFETSFANPGSYEIDVNGISDSIIIKAPENPAQFVLGTLSVSPTTVEYGNDVSIKIEVSNSGSLTGPYEVVLKINNNVTGTRQITLASGQSQSVEFIILGKDSGTFSVNVNGKTGSFTVKPLPEVLETSNINWWLIGGIITIITAAAMFVLLFVRRQSK